MSDERSKVTDLERELEELRERLKAEREAKELFEQQLAEQQKKSEELQETQISLQSQVSGLEEQVTKINSLPNTLSRLQT